ncbi:MAG: hypothetical protein KTR31_20130 [Myxococcales bacterium]|nr:hypothetical protein [Myxococcales bacterium]
MPSARTVVLVLCGLFSAQGLSWVVLGSLEPTGFYDGLLASSQLGTEALSPDAIATMRFLLVPFGATDAAYFALAGLLAYHAFHERWAWRAVAVSFALWFVVDTAGCAWLGAWFNVGVVNLPCLALFGPALWAWHATLASPT